MKELERYFEYEKEGQKIIIRLLHSPPLAKQDGRVRGGNSKYIEHIEFLLIQYLRRCAGYRASFIMARWWYYLGMVNNWYNKYSDRERLRKELMEINPLFTDFQLRKFHRRSGGDLNSIFIKSLDSLVKRGLLEYRKDFMIVDYNNHHRIADGRDIEKIEEIERIVLYDMGLDSKAQVFNKLKHDKFFKKIKALGNKRYGWSFIYSSYALVMTSTEKVELASFDTIQNERMLLNAKIVERIGRSIQSENTRDIKRHEYVTDRFFEEVLNSDDCFLSQKSKEEECRRIYTPP